MRGIELKSLIAVSAITLLGLGVSGCGGASKGIGSTSDATSSIATSTSRSDARPPGASSAQGYRNDDDNDPSSDEDLDDLNGKNVDEDKDEPEDKTDPENGFYHDKDDLGIVSYGHAAGVATMRMIAATVKRYYAVAAAENGTKACTMIFPSYAAAIAEDYGQAPGPAYLRGAKTCSAVLVRVFKRSHSQLVGSFTVTGARVEGDHAIALLGSTTMPASEISLTEAHGAWWISEIISSPLM
jgi:hypothetical protein